MPIYMIPLCHVASEARTCFVQDIDNIFLSMIQFMDIDGKIYGKIINIDILETEIINPSGWYI